MAELDLIDSQISLIWAKSEGDPWPSKEFRKLQSQSNILRRQLPKLRATELLEHITETEQALKINPSFNLRIYLLELHLDYERLYREIKIQEHLENLEKQKQAPLFSPHSSRPIRRKSRAHRSLWKGK